MSYLPSPARWTRRAWLGAGAAGLLSACGTPLPLGTALAPSSAARQRLLDSAKVHGWDAYRRFTDINVAYSGQWRPLINGIQPEVVDGAYRGPSEERLLPAQGVVAQAYRGTRDGSLRKQVFWQRGDGSAARPGDVGLWYDGQPSSDAARRAASAVVAECYGLFLLGPLWLAGRELTFEPKAELTAEMSGTERVHGRLCDVVQVSLRPGLGLSAEDRVALLIDRDDGITRRLRFTLEGFAGTRGAVAEVDWLEFATRFGVLWPVRSYEEVVHPLRLPAHDWVMTGLDVNRGYGVEALRGPVFTGAAAAPAAPL